MLGLKIVAPALLQEVDICGKHCGKAVTGDKYRFTDQVNVD